MKRLTAIVAVNEDGIIGCANRLPWRVKSDLRFFRQQTVNNVVVMGRKTYDSLGVCLPERLNIVVTHGFRLFVEGPLCLQAHGIDEALARAESKRSRSQDVFIIGGASMYDQFAPYVDRYLITEIKKSVPDGDTWLRHDLLGEISDWDRRTLAQGEANDQGDEAAFTIFELKSKRANQIKEVRDLAIQSHLSKGKPQLRRQMALQAAHV